MDCLGLDKTLKERLQRLSQAHQIERLKGGLIGLEKEGLRVSPHGGISQKPHPEALGSPLTNRYITTDYSEALTEIITPPSADREEPLRLLFEAHHFLYQHLGDEILWSTSMPCVVEGDEMIPIAGYGSSNAGMMKTVYRRGLGHRYGRVMQVIAGVHFNYSLPQAFWHTYQMIEEDKGPTQTFISESYFAMLRNLQRVGWLIPYLFGASPAVCKSFLGGRPTSLQKFDDYTYYSPHATSLRMGDIGYQNSKEQGTGIKACYDSLAAYIKSLSCAIETPCPIYQAIGVKVDGRYEQLNANILQIENEYYSTVRPKQIPEMMEKPIHALKRRGVRYVELRSLDVNAFHPLGIAEEQVYFVEALMLLCLLQESPKINAEEQKAIDWNELAAAHQGREPGLELQRHGGGVLLRDWGLEICDAIQPICEILEAGMPGEPYSRSLMLQRQRLQDADLTPSARMLAEMRDKGESFFQFAQRMSKQHQHYFNQQAYSSQDQELLIQEARDSWRRQREIEASDTIGFDAFLADYFSQQIDATSQAEEEKWHISTG
ncbi:MAG: glutamate--cysteine ligase [Candidatus Thiodiazotropha sp. (ex Dulcina madagascariensis)]|nr:glutamate--cysteine ligase [Candidatus Thiodiazotropha sp. (ex Dulcina madagascariensis)]MCU7925222.1 glutamate--cysteine ligase [Candidatus Thiodiazotropha sp. (ex Dulcina madagascariensis)]